MSDIIDLIRAKLAAAKLTPEEFERTMLEVRMRFRGDTVYIRQPKVRELATQLKRPIRSRRIKEAT